MQNKKAIFKKNKIIDAERIFEKLNLSDSYDACFTRILIAEYYLSQNNTSSCLKYLDKIQHLETDETDINLYLRIDYLKLRHDINYQLKDTFQSLLYLEKAIQVSQKLQDDHPERQYLNFLKYDILAKELQNEKNSRLHFRSLFQNQNNFLTNQMLADENSYPDFTYKSILQKQANQKKQEKDFEWAQEILLDLLKVSQKVYGKFSIQTVQVLEQLSQNQEVLNQQEEKSQQDEIKQNLIYKILLILKKTVNSGCIKSCLLAIKYSKMLKNNDYESQYFQFFLRLLLLEQSTQKEKIQLSQTAKCQENNSLQLCTELFSLITNFNYMQNLISCKFLEQKQQYSKQDLMSLNFKKIKLYLSFKKIKQQIKRFFVNDSHNQCQLNQISKIYKFPQQNQNLKIVINQLYQIYQQLNLSALKQKNSKNKKQKQIAFNKIKCDLKKFNFINHQKVQNNVENLKLSSLISVNSQKPVKNTNHSSVLKQQNSKNKKIKQLAINKIQCEKKFNFTNHQKVQINIENLKLYSLISVNSQKPVKDTNYKFNFSNKSLDCYTKPTQTVYYSNNNQSCFKQNQFNFVKELPESYRKKKNLSDNQEKEINSQISHQVSGDGMLPLQAIPLQSFQYVEVDYQETQKYSKKRKTLKRHKKKFYNVKKLIKSKAIKYYQNKTFNVLKRIDKQETEVNNQKEQKEKEVKQLTLYNSQSWDQQNFESQLISEIIECTLEAGTRSIQGSSDDNNVHFLDQSQDAYVAEEQTCMKNPSQQIDFKKENMDILHDSQGQSFKYIKDKELNQQLKQLQTQINLSTVSQRYNTETQQIKKDLFLPSQQSQIRRYPLSSQEKLQLELQQCQDVVDKDYSKNSAQYNFEKKLSQKQISYIVSSDQIYQNLHSSDLYHIQGSLVNNLADIHHKIYHEKRSKEPSNYQAEAHNQQQLQVVCEQFHQNNYNLRFEQEQEFLEDQNYVQSEQKFDSRDSEMRRERIISQGDYNTCNLLFRNFEFQQEINYQNLNQDENNIYQNHFNFNFEQNSYQNQITQIQYSLYNQSDDEYHYINGEQNTRLTYIINVIDTQLLALDLELQQELYQFQYQDIQSEHFDPLPDHGQNIFYEYPKIELSNSKD